MTVHRGGRNVAPVALAALALMPAVAVGCGSAGSRSVSPAGWPDKAELAWMRAYGRWSRQVETALANFQAERAALFRTFGSEGMPGLRRAAAAVEAECAHDALATPPTARLQPAFRAARSGCRLYASVARAVRTTRTAIVYGVMSNSLVDLLRQGDQGFRSARDRALLGTDSLTAKAATQSSLRSHIDPQLGRVAGRFARHAVRVRCWSASDWRRVSVEYAALSGRALSRRYDGWTPVGGSTIELDGEFCARLEKLRAQARSPGVENAATATAVRVLTHEAEHAAGVSNEATAECYALQTLSDVARDLGVSKPDAANLARIAWAEYPEEPAGYSTSKCHNGGPLDLRPNDAVWP